MADDEQVVNTGETETPDAPATSAEEKTTSDDKPEAPEAPEKAETTQEPPDLTDGEKKSLSDKAQKRIRYLAEKAKKADELEAKGESEGPEKFMGALQPQPMADSQQPGQPKGLPWDPQSAQPTEPREISPEEYEQEVAQKADMIASARVKFENFKLKKEFEIKDDYKKIVGKWDVLNPESSSYNKELSDTIGGLFDKQLQADPNAKLYKLTESIMKVRKGGQEQGKTEVTTKLVEQKAEEAVTPSPETGPAPEKPEALFNDPKRVDEQEAWLKKHGAWE